MANSTDDALAPKERRQMRRRVILAVELACGASTDDAAAKAGLSPAEARQMARQQVTRILVESIHREAAQGLGEPLAGLLAAVLRRHGIDPAEVFDILRRRAAAATV